MQRLERKFMTDEQLIAILRDDAIFSDGMAARRRAICELVEFGTRAIPMLREIMECNISTKDDQGAVALCRQAIERISDENNISRNTN